MKNKKKSRIRQHIRALRRKKRKFVREAVKKAIPREVEISWADYYAMCPNCGSWEAEDDYRHLRNYCPKCGQRLKNVDTGSGKKE